MTEELWSIAGGDGFVAEHIIEIKNENVDDRNILERELFVHSIIDQARQMKELAERHLDGGATSVTIQCSESWKGELVRTGIELLESDFPMR